MILVTRDDVELETYTLGELDGVPKGHAGSTDIEMSNYFGRQEQLLRGPQAYKANVPIANFVLPPHWHLVDQFQIIVQGTGSYIGRYEYDPINVHYTDSYTPYGPINMGAQGQGWFTLRTQHDIGVQAMPESRRFMARKSGRGLHIPLPSDRTLPGAGEVQENIIIAPEDDGLAAYEIVAGPNSTIPDVVAGGSGRYELVLKGGVITETGAKQNPEDITFAVAGEQLRRHTGPDGTRLLSLQLPRV